MKLKVPFRSISVGWLWLSGVIVLVGIGGFTFNRWWPVAQDWVRNTIAAQKKENSSDGHAHSEGEGQDGHDHGGHAHAHDEGTSLELSQQAMGNVGLSEDFLKPVQLETFLRSITVPAIIVERPGRTRIQVSTPMAGVITHVHAVRGEAITPGTLLFEIRITADELVATQTELLKTIGGIDVENREIARLEEVTKSGAVSQKTLLERQYAKDKLEVLLAAQKEALRLQGLSDRQIQDISVNRRLLRDLQIRVPAPDQHNEDELELTNNKVSQADYSEADHSQPADGHDVPLLILQDVLVSKGERVLAGTTLAVLSDMSELYLEGRAFEQDARLLAAAAANNWKVTAVFEQGGQQSEEVPGLELLYAASDVNVQSRTLPFYVRLPNQLTRDVPSPNGLRFIEWKYRPGQRLQLRVPVEEWQQQIVFPVDAIAQEGAEAFVFQQNGNHFDRVPVHVIYRDQAYAVIKNDGSVFPGDIVAQRGAHQLQMALKNKSGGGADPHAGHNH
ncbi:efflux RND transporter periplasmic adaptor subunit [Planctomicrobium sp. SH527]|uniref:efflux RND transporter periplasmic adaptor subunit n=1 Tax=Planctomicrobium sp. SH527 TaxID=3448123 RepID=UPI003F5C1C60